ncbi:HEAT repeat domain-containing protein [Candidatus Saccharibacteria bacterium]|nr:HEAT repeat domain-containing protein [Candidatus Saccharibacteria bacterium]
MIPIGTIERMLDSSDAKIRLAAAKALATHEETTLDLVESVLDDDNEEVRKAAKETFAEVFGGDRNDLDYAEDDIVRIERVECLIGVDDVGDKLLKKGFSDWCPEVRFATAKLYSQMKNRHDETIKELSNSDNEDVKIAVCSAKIMRHDINMEDLAFGLNSSDNMLREVAQKALKEHLPRLAVSYLLENVKNRESRDILLESCAYWLPSIPEEVLREGLLNKRTRKEVENAFLKNHQPANVIKRLTNSEEEIVRYVAMRAAFDNQVVPFSVIQSCFNDPSPKVRNAAIRSAACAPARYQVTAEMLESWLLDPDVSSTAIFVLKHINNLDVYEGLLSSENVLVREIAASIFKSKQNKNEFNDEEGEKKIIHKILVDEDPTIREKMIQKPARTFEPPEKVYANCLGSVVAVLTIPAYAQVKGMPGVVCKTDAAEVISILGDLYGEKICIPEWDVGQVFEIGETIKAKDDCWIQFYCTREEVLKAKHGK